MSCQDHVGMAKPYCKYYLYFYIFYIWKEKFIESNKEDLCMIVNNSQYTYDFTNAVKV